MGSVGFCPFAIARPSRAPEPIEVSRRYFELCLFTQVANELKSGDLCIPGSDEYGDYRRQLVSWEEYRRDVGAYAEQAGLPADPKALVAALKSELAATAAAVDKAFPDNENVKIVDGEPVLKRLHAFHTTVGMMKALGAIRADGLGDAITDEALAGLSPYLTEHINRFGDYVLDLSQRPEPLPFAIPPQRARRSPQISNPGIAPAPAKASA